MALWLGNPTLNPAVLVFIVLTLGWGWAALRLVFGVALIVAAALVAAKLTSRMTIDAPRAGDQPVVAEDGERWGLAWLRTFARLALRLSPEYLIMVAVLGAARAYLFPMGFHLGGGVWVLVAAAVAGTLFVIPTAGEVPIVQTMLAAGAGAAPAAALLMTLAPLSAPSLLMLSRVLPRRVLAAAAALTAAAGVAAGITAHAFGF
jgi:uncharacterized membrane protein YraQ (UPF0718 family)